MFSSISSELVEEAFVARFSPITSTRNVDLNSVGLLRTVVSRRDAKALDVLCAARVQPSMSKDGKNSGNGYGERDGPNVQSARNLAEIAWVVGRAGRRYTAAVRDRAPVFFARM